MLTAPALSQHRQQQASQLDSLKTASKMQYEDNVMDLRDDPPAYHRTQQQTSEMVDVPRNPLTASLGLCFALTIDQIYHTKGAEITCGYLEHEMKEAGLMNGEGVLIYQYPHNDAKLGMVRIYPFTFRLPDDKCNEINGNKTVMRELLDLFRESRANLIHRIELVRFEDTCSPDPAGLVELAITVNLTQLIDLHDRRSNRERAADVEKRTSHVSDMMGALEDMKKRLAEKDEAQRNLESENAELKARLREANEKAAPAAVEKAPSLKRPREEEKEAQQERDGPVISVPEPSSPRSPVATAPPPTPRLQPQPAPQAPSDAPAPPKKRRIEQPQPQAPEKAQKSAEQEAAAAPAGKETPPAAAAVIDLDEAPAPAPTPKPEAAGAPKKPAIDAKEANDAQFVKKANNASTLFVQRWLAPLFDISEQDLHTYDHKPAEPLSAYLSKLRSAVNWLRKQRASKYAAAAVQKDMPELVAKFKMQPEIMINIHGIKFLMDWAQKDRSGKMSAVDREVYGPNMIEAGKTFIDLLRSNGKRADGLDLESAEDFELIRVIPAEHYGSSENSALILSCALPLVENIVKVFDVFGADLSKEFGYNVSDHKTAWKRTIKAVNSNLTRMFEEAKKSDSGKK
jgi:hypothetical protein